ncbi:MAG: YihY/virulence factor BrkB family protein [Flavicella sp.]
MNQVVNFLKNIKIPGLEGLSLYDLIEVYFTGIVKGALTSRAGGISYSLFMAVFPFLLFMLTLIPYIPVDGFQESFMLLISEALPPKTYEAVVPILEDIANNKYGGLLSFGFLVSIFLMTNGVNAIFGGFEISYHVTEVRTVVKAYIVSLGTSLLMSFLLIVTVVGTILFQFGLDLLIANNWLSSEFMWLENVRYLFLVFMIFTTVSLLYFFGTKEGKYSSFFSVGAILTTILYVISFYIFGVYVVKFAKYNELYGSIGTLLIVMLFIWLNAIILLLGFELNATMNKLRLTSKA